MKLASVFLKRGESDDFMGRRALGYDAQLTLGAPRSLVAGGKRANHHGFLNRNVIDSVLRRISFRAVPFTMNRETHWNLVYTRNPPDDVSWYQKRPDVSLAMIGRSAIAKDAGLIDVGGGASTLVDFLLADGWSGMAVLDIASAALEHTKTRLGARAAEVEWIVADVTAFVPRRAYGLWHDRAVFHFLTEAVDRRQYVEALRRAVPVGGQVIIAGFAPHGPEKCSGLPVCRHDSASLEKELGGEFVLIEHADEIHRTPWEAEQAFRHRRFQRNKA